MEAAGFQVQDSVGGLEMSMVILSVADKTRALKTFSIEDRFNCGSTLSLDRLTNERSSTVTDDVTSSITSWCFLQTMHLATNNQHDHSGALHKRAAEEQ
jgi:hypothetical protein